MTRNRPWPRIIGWALLGAVGAGCVVDDGEPQSSWGIDPGECLQWPELLEEPQEPSDPTDEVASSFFLPAGEPTIVPCDELHHLELVAVFELPQGDFPGAFVVDATAEERCAEALDAYVSGPIPPTLWMSWWLPTTADAWEVSRVIECTIEGSHRGAVGQAVLGEEQAATANVSRPL